jgi:2-dehydro-3-deoxyphosphooctonate aldolase (KDO 8-P synthase)
MTVQHTISINRPGGALQVGNDLPFILIAGPCQIESREIVMETAEELSTITAKLGIPFIFKSSFDKANRTSIHGQRGIGLSSALPIFQEVRSKFSCPIITDVHTAEQCEELKDYVDILQIPALLCRQTDLLIAAANTGLPVNVKKGQFMAPWDMKNVAEKISSTGNTKILLTERGTSFGYNRLISDMRALPIMAQTGYPVIFDATHSVQEPSGHGTQSAGNREYVPALSRAAIAVGVAGLFIETHPDPDNAASDGPCMMRLKDMSRFLEEMFEIDQLIKSKYGEK